MKIGVNWTSPRHIRIVRSLLQEGKASFCEVMIDNFLHLTPQAVGSAFPNTPLAFHIMNSEFIQNDAAGLESLAARLKVFIRELRPIYVSDHLALFRHKDRRLPFLQEIDYHGQYDETRERTARWQELLGTRLFLENYPSFLDIGKAQPDFIAKLTEETGAGVLFDFSNAVVAGKNCGVALAAWSPLIRQTRHFHAAGYRLAGTDPDLLQDSHDGELSEDTLNFFRENKTLLTDPRNCTIVIERDARIEMTGWSKDIAGAEAAFA